MELRESLKPEKHATRPSLFFSSLSDEQVKVTVKSKPKISLLQVKGKTESYIRDKPVDDSNI